MSLWDKRGVAVEDYARSSFKQKKHNRKCDHHIGCGVGPKTEEHNTQSPMRPKRKTLPRTKNEASPRIWTLNFVAHDGHLTPKMVGS